MGRMRVLRLAAAILSIALAVPSAAAGATLSVDPVNECYREQQRVFLLAQGFTPNGEVDFTRGDDFSTRLRADASGTIQGNLRLPGVLMGRRTLTYVGTDVTDPGITAQVSLLTTATDVRVKPKTGLPNRRLTIRARGFRGGRTLWAHVRRVKRRGGGPVRVRNVRLGGVEGPCWTVRARKRLFRRSTAPGRYRVQFDTFRRYEPRRKVEYDELRVTILSPARGR
jgi:hypothetical protein